MGDAIKWGLLATAIIVLIALVVALPFTNFIDVGEFTNGLTTIVNVCGNAFTSARGLINSFLTPFGRNLVTGMLIWFFGKWAITITIKITAWVYHFIFK
jgi:hypothetical protein